jgi:hypothetical protein
MPGIDRDAGFVRRQVERAAGPRIASRVLVETDGRVALVEEQVSYRFRSAI